MFFSSSTIVLRRASFKSSRSLLIVLFTLVASACAVFDGNARADELRGRLKAIVVSVGDFGDSSLKDLVGGDLQNKQRVVETSANAVTDALRKVVVEEIRDDVETLQNAKRDEIQAAIEEKAKELDEEDALVVYFCGFAAATPNNDDLLLWAKDTKRGDDSTALSASQIRQTLANAGSRKTLLLVDAQTYGRGVWEARGKTRSGERALGPALGEDEELAKLDLPATDGASVATLLSSPRPLKNGVGEFGLISLDDRTFFSSLVALGLRGFADRSAVGKVGVNDLIKFVESGLKAARLDEDGVALWGTKSARSFELVENYSLEESTVVEGLAAFTRIYAAVEREETRKSELQIACPDFDCGSIAEGTNLPAFKDSQRCVGELLLKSLCLNSGGLKFKLGDDPNACDLVLRNTTEAKGKGFLYKTRVERYDAEIFALIGVGKSRFDEKTRPTATRVENSAPVKPEGTDSNGESSSARPSIDESRPAREKVRPMKLAEFPGTVAVLVDGKERAQYDAMDGRTNVVELNPGETYSIQVKTNANLLGKYPGGIGLAILVDGRTTLIKRTDGSGGRELELEDFPFVTPEKAPFYVVEKSGATFIFNGYVCFDSQGGRHVARAFTVGKLEEDAPRGNIINDDSVGTISLWFYELKPLNVGKKTGPVRGGGSENVKTNLGQIVRANVKTTVPREKKDGGAYGAYRLWYESKWK